mmetsp:Transcript_10371/g.24014  ORF Transcript_10371/g.24014 Transcript_10371/m.24014 type:complete len:182 (+) Transcript_10371:67-612(+)
MVKAIIVAKAKANVIGKDGQLPWHLPKDLQHFKCITMGHHVIMGRKTFESLKQPLSGRNLIIITRNPHYQVAGSAVVHDINTALVLAEQTGETEVLIAGGAMIYRAMLALVDKIYLTEVNASIAGDVFFPTICSDVWKEVKRTPHPADERHLYTYDFVELVKRTPSHNSSENSRSLHKKVL